MSDEKVLTAEELERLPFEERHRVVAEGIVADVSEVAADFVARARTRGAAILAERGIALPPG